MSSPGPLGDSVQYVKGCGPRRAERLARLNIHTVDDLLYFVPRDYLDLSEVTLIEKLEDGRASVVRGKVTWFVHRTTRSGVPVTELLCEDDTGQISVTWFHRSDLHGAFALGQEIQLTGKAKSVDTIWRMANPKVQPLSSGDQSLRIVPVYPLTEGLEARELRPIIERALEDYSQAIPDLLPSTFREAHGLPPIADALKVIHHPLDRQSLVSARRRLIFDEFLVLQVALALKRNAIKHRVGLPMPALEEVDRRIRRLFPFRLTRGQDAAVEEIRADLAGLAPMRRLLQGDVGSGKTAVAIYAILTAIAAGYQAALMAPTEVLARQQFAVLDETLSKSRVRRGLLIGSLAQREKEALLAALHAGEIDLVVGTHALVQPSVRFHRLGLVVIDEQHKFGVRQRAELLKQDPPPHQLIMTATPIPRSLSMTWFGDLDLSLIRDKPPGRKEVTTHVVDESKRAKAYEHLARRVRMGESGIVVCSRIHGIDSLRGVTEVYEEMQNGLFRDLPIAMVHGRLEDERKNEVIRGFRKGDVRVLVSTVVVEVGLDVPNASIVLIENAERFGLNQLHQIRGRVGRGDRGGSCFLLHGQDQGETRDRLEAIARTTDGFQVSELDAQIRGIGDLLSEKQHGFLRPRMGDFVADRPILEEVRQGAAEILAADSRLSSLPWAELRRRVLRRFGKSFAISLVG